MVKLNPSPVFGLNKRNALLLLIFALLITGCQSDVDKGRTWSVYKADAESSSYSPLDQINQENVGQLEIAWTFTPDDAPEGARFGRSESNPIIIDGVMYTTSARHRLYAINAENGKQIWSFDPFYGGRGGGVSRGHLLGRWWGYQDLVHCGGPAFCGRCGNRGAYPGFWG